MTDRVSTAGAVLMMGYTQESKEEEETNCSSGTGGSQQKDSEKLLSLPELEEVLYSAPRSCRHVDEVWPNLHLGDM